MARFSFRLGRVERVRRIREELARNDLLQAERVLTEARERLQRAGSELARALEEIERAQAEPSLDAALVLAAQETLPGLQARLSRRRTQVAERESAADGARAAWRAARADVRALEKLEQRERVAFQDAERAREDKVRQENADRKAAVSASGAAPTENNR